MGRAAICVVLIAALPASAAPDGGLELDGGAPDAGSPWDDPIYAACPPADAPVQLDDGSFKLSPLRAARNACMLASCENDRGHLAAGPPVLSGWTLLFGAAMATLALLAGLYLGWDLRSIVVH